MTALFRAYPDLEKKVHHHPLCDLPTPVEPLPDLQAELELDGLYVKRDDQTHAVYGGNKVRKLEFTLGEALRFRHNTVITFGFAGSNHATATAVHASRLNLTCLSMLLPQPNATYVRRNLLLSHAHNAQLQVFTKKFHLSLATLKESLKRGFKTGKTPYIIPPGGTSPIGALGFVNAALELKDQIDAGVLPPPDRIYVPLGTAGTSVGLLIGLKSVGLETRLVPVRVVPRDFANLGGIARLFRETVAFLRSKDPSFPKLVWCADDFRIEDGFLGDGYAHFTEAGMAAMDMARALGGLHLDGSYSGKAMAALVAHSRAGVLKGRRVLFWNTLNSRDFSPLIENVDAASLPSSLHEYFLQPVQRLDRGD